jgi:hypothetical protein
MTTKESHSRNLQTVAKVEAVLQVHQQLRQYAEGLHVSIENAAVVVRGELPSADLKLQLVPAVRQAGVLCQVNDCVQVAG